MESKACGAPVKHLLQIIAEQIEPVGDGGQPSRLQPGGDGLTRYAIETKSTRGNSFVKTHGYP
jgi:hypothetical protein